LGRTRITNGTTVIHGPIPNDLVGSISNTTTTNISAHLGLAPNWALVDHWPRMWHDRFDSARNKIVTTITALLITRGVPSPRFT
jgi:hypothetical protein